MGCATSSGIGAKTPQCSGSPPPSCSPGIRARLPCSARTTPAHRATPAGCPALAAQTPSSPRDASRNPPRTWSTYLFDTGRIAIVSRKKRVRPNRALEKCASGVTLSTNAHDVPNIAASDKWSISTIAFNRVRSSWRGNICQHRRISQRATGPRQTNPLPFSRGRR